MPTGHRPPTGNGLAVLEALHRLGAAVGATGAGVEAGGTLPAVHGDLGRLARVFQNPTDNALKFARPGLPPEVQVTAGREAGAWYLRVSDEASGWRRTWSASSRGSGACKGRPYGGSELGLAICRRLVERHGAASGPSPARRTPRPLPVSSQVLKYSSCP